jgi:hypothetical protein
MGNGIFPALPRAPLLLFAFWMLVALSAHAHIGSPNVFFEGQAGPYPVHVIIRPAEVIPGLAEISVRVDAGGIERVTALPIKWNAGRKGAPPPDVASLVRGETNLYYAELWFMEPGSQSVELEVRGTSGNGRVTIPVDAVARRVLGMPKFLGGTLAGLGFILAALLLSVIGAATRESMLEPGLAPLPRRRWWARGAMAIGALVIVLGLWGGKRWWEAEATDYRNNRLYKPITAAAQVHVEHGQRVLRLEITDPKFARSAPLVPDHGKLMHLFLVREPKLDAFAHLHPIKRDRKMFETVVPDLPAGAYRVYADVTYETGYSDTFTTAVEVPEIPSDASAASRSAALDADDSWRIAPALGSNGQECRLTPDYTMTWLAPRRIGLNQPVTLRFALRNTAGQSVLPDPYLGMRGHLALRRDDGSVFTHLHPGGSASMAAMQLSVLRAEGKLPLNAAFGADDPLCQLPAESTTAQEWLAGRAGEEGVSFPYAFPKAGRYRLWVQVKVKGQILTGVYDVDVDEGG